MTEYLIQVDVFFFKDISDECFRLWWVTGYGGAPTPDVNLQSRTNITGLNQPPATPLLSVVYVYIWLCLSDLRPVSPALIIVFLSWHPLRWAQFFICPLMIRDAIDREVEAVDSGESRCLCASFFPSWEVKFHCWLLPTQLFFFFFLHTIDHFLLSWVYPVSPSVFSEYQLAKPSDSHRKEMLFGSLAKPGHPMGKFCWGELVNTTAGTHNTHRASLGYVQQ